MVDRKMSDMYWKDIKSDPSIVMVSTDLYAIRPDPIKVNILITFYLTS